MLAGTPAGIAGGLVITAVIRSELLKFRSVRSSVVLAVLAVLSPVALTVLIAALVPDTEFIDAGDGFNLVTGSLTIMQLLLAVMGALVIAAEYRFGTIRVTFTAVPNRAVVLLAKAAVVVMVALAIGIVTTLANLAVASGVLTARGIDSSLTGDDGLRALAGHVIVGILYGLVGFGLGALFRSPVAAIVVVVCQPVIVEPILFAVRNQLFRWLPFTAGGALTTVDPPEELVQSPLAGGLVLAACALALAVAGGWLVMRRDA